jgi:hypothetical protein
MRTSWESFVLNNLKTSVYTAIEISLQKRKNIHFPGQAAGGERSGGSYYGGKKGCTRCYKRPGPGGLLPHGNCQASRKT